MQTNNYTKLRKRLHYSTLFVLLWMLSLASAVHASDGQGLVMAEPSLMEKTQAPMEIMLSTMEEAASPVAKSELKGDVNDDGESDIVDVMLMVNYILYIPINGTFNPEIADLDHDGEVTVVDVMMLVDYILYRSDNTDAPRPDDDVANPDLPVLAPHHPQP